MYADYFSGTLGSAAQLHQMRQRGNLPLYAASSPIPLIQTPRVLNRSMSVTCHDHGTTRLPVMGPPRRVVPEVPRMPALDLSTLIDLEVGRDGVSGGLWGRSL